MKKALWSSVLCLLWGSAQAAPIKHESNQAAFLLEYSKGADLEQFGVGLGIHPTDARSGFGGLYYGEKTLRQDIRTDIQTLGFRGFSTEGGVDDPRGADLTLAISRTETNEGYQRSGFSARAIMYTPIAHRTTWFVGADLRPTFLSFDWSNDVLTEIGLEAGINVRLLDDLALYGLYYHETRWLDDLSTKRFASGVAAGINWVW